MKLFPMKSPRHGSSARRPLQASVARQGIRAQVIEEEEEPTTSFKTTLIVAVLLHVVAAGGIFMFESIKKRNPNAFDSASASSVKKVSAPAQAHPTATPVNQAKQQVMAGSTEAAKTDTVKKMEKPASAAAPLEAKDSGKVYVVARGDTPVSIAKKFQINSDDLLKLNKIDDPKKLKPGMKLRIPLKSKTATS